MEVNKLVSRHRESGISPVNSFDDKSNVVSNAKFPKSGGIKPLSELSPRLRTFNDVEIDSGIVPMNKLDDKSSNNNDVIYEI